MKSTVHRIVTDEKGKITNRCIAKFDDRADAYNFWWRKMVENGKREEMNLTKGVTFDLRNPDVNGGLHFPFSNVKEVA